jgi:hypothetical protein
MKNPNTYATFEALRMGTVKLTVIWDMTLQGRVVN